MKRVKVFDNQDDLYSKSQIQDQYQDENRVIDCAHLIENEVSSSDSDTSDSDENSER